MDAYSCSVQILTLSLQSVSMLFIFVWHWPCFLLSQCWLSCWWWTVIQILLIYIILSIFHIPFLVKCCHSQNFHMQLKKAEWVIRYSFHFSGTSGLTSDSGWGCTMRCGQMLLAETLSRRHLPAGAYSLGQWNWQADMTDQTCIKWIKRGLRCVFWSLPCDPGSIKLRPSKKN